MDRLTVVCVLKSGGVYNAGHVALLQRQVAQHLFAAHRFVCLSDVDVPCERIPLKHNWPGWWSKIELFRTGLFEDIALYIDLDTVVIDDINDLARARHRFTMLRNMSRGAPFVGSGLMAWSADLSKIHDTFLKDPAGHMKRCTTPDCWGDQGFIFKHTPVVPDYWQDRFPGRVVSYKMHCRPRGGVAPKDAAIVCYHGQPRPWEAPLRSAAA